MLKSLNSFLPFMSLAYASQKTHEHSRMSVLSIIQLRYTICSHSENLLRALSFHSFPENLRKASLCSIGWLGLWKDVVLLCTEKLPSGRYFGSLQKKKKYKFPCLTLTATTISSHIHTCTHTYTFIDALCPGERGSVLLDWSLWYRWKNNAALCRQF